MKRYTFWCVVALIVLLSCAHVKKVSFRATSSTPKYIIEIPKGYTYEGLAGSHEKESRYWYPDSSVIYFTTFKNTLNYNEIRKQETYYSRFDAIHANDTLSLAGEDSLGLYWKDVLLGGVTVGYSNVPGSDKKHFDSIVSAVIIRD